MPPRRHSHWLFHQRPQQPSSTRAQRRPRQQQQEQQQQEPEPPEFSTVRPPQDVDANAAARMIRTRAREGDPEAQYHVGRSYFYGQTGSGTCDYDKARIWLEKCCCGSTTTTTTRTTGTTTPRSSSTTTTRYYDDDNDVDYRIDAAYLLGLCYRHGSGPAGRDWIAAAYWLLRAAQSPPSGSGHHHHHRRAMMELARLYEVGGYGLTMNLSQAYYWLERANHRRRHDGTTGTQHIHPQPQQHPPDHIQSHLERVLTKLQRQQYVQRVESEIHPSPAAAPTTTTTTTTVVENNHNNNHNEDDENETGDADADDNDDDDAGDDTTTSPTSVVEQQLRLELERLRGRVQTLEEQNERLLRWVVGQRNGSEFVPSSLTSPS